MRSPKISVIIPVYNVEIYLNECVDSIINQSFKDIEIILVDDGSTDGSGKICDEYGSEYDNIKVIHKKNGGASDARNIGLCNAIGEYILFIDSDDYIGENSLTVINQTLMDTSLPDVVFLEGFKVFSDGKTVSLGDGYKGEKINDCSKDVVMEHLSKTPKFSGSGCTKAIRRQLLIDKDLFFEKGIVCEDIDWCLRLYNEAETFGYCSVPYYYYRQSRQGSVTNNIGTKHFRSLLEIIDKFSDKDLTKARFQKEINAFMAYEYIILLYMYALLNESEKKEERNNIKMLSWLLNCRSDRKTQLIRIVYKIFGLNITSKLLGFYMKIR